MENKKNVLSIDCDYALTVQSLTNEVRFFLQHIKKIDLENIVFSQIHANIFYTLEPLLQREKQIDILTIDDHHDIYGKDNVIFSDHFDSTDWLGHYLGQDNFIQNAYWLCNYESSKTCSINRYDDIMTIMYDFEEIEFDKFDYLFVCISPITAHHHLSYSLFNVLIEIVKNEKKCKKYDFYKKNILNHSSKHLSPQRGLND